MDIPSKSKDNEPGVLKEVDCYISPAMQKQILLLLVGLFICGFHIQYKNRENYHTLDNELIKEARIKPNLDLLEFIVRDGRSSFVEPAGDQIDTYLLRSKTVTFPRTLLGYFVNDECHFIPLGRDVLVLDTCKEPVKVEKNQNSNSSTSTTVGPATFVSARLRTADANALRGPMASRRKPADSDPDIIFLRQQTQTPWCPVLYKRFIPNEAFERRIPLLYPNDDMAELTKNRVTGLSQEDYVNSLLAAVTPNVVDRNRTEPVKPPTLEELIQAIMVKAQLIRFNKLVMCVRERFKDPHSVTNASVLQHLPMYAVLLRGWWVVKSEILYPPNSYSEHSGAPSALLIRARDYIMAVFHRGEHLTRKTISCMTKVPTIEATEMLKSLACKMSTTQKGCANHWEFHPTDYDFIKRYPDVVQQQQVAWEIRIRQLCTQLKLERLVSDGVRRKRIHGRHSGESGSDSETGLKSLVSGVHISTPGKHTNRKRKRQLSLCHTTDTENNGANSSHKPDRKRARTQSLSLSYSFHDSLSHSPAKLPRLQTDVPSEFHAPISPPPVKLMSPKAKVTSSSVPDISGNSSSPLVEAVACKQEPHSPEKDNTTAPSPPPADFTASLPTSQINVKLSPPSQNISQLAVDGNESSEFSSQIVRSVDNTTTTDLHCMPLQSVVSHDNNVNVDTNNDLPEAMMNTSINLVKNILNTQPIVALSSLTKIYQQQLGNFDANFHFALWKSSPPPPGSEIERELLKTHILKALNVIGARQLTVRWPTIPTALEEEPLFVIQVAGPECGAVSESVAQFRDVILALYESFPSFKMKDLQEKCSVFPPKGMSEKAMRAFIKQYCIFRHGRYFLRCTVADD
ncbi:DNA-directed RNA polymerase III subunit RPC5 isoform 2 [Schistosoma japonicum]|uniref:DNA-directed RNA polymerase III subunit RPC5 isoform 2 n=2 Tax=Schistosoma japonicum TaxID=6182 RepID=A0A4Z2D4E7_SCHJA|nr:DNA-directed RNA polymerase III subunit RPC5 isoform 2 [Schistosoma japonicum]